MLVALSCLLGQPSVFDWAANGWAVAVPAWVPRRRAAVTAAVRGSLGMEADSCRGAVTRAAWLGLQQLA